MALVKEESANLRKNPVKSCETGQTSETISRLQVTSNITSLVNTDYCWSGDYKGTFYDGRTCNEVVQDSKWLCYDDKYRDACCARCESVRDKSNDGTHEASNLLKLNLVNELH